MQSQSASSDQTAKLRAWCDRARGDAPRFKWRYDLALELMHRMIERHEQAAARVALRPFVVALARAMVVPRLVV